MCSSGGHLFYQQSHFIKLKVHKISKKVLDSLVKIEAISHIYFLHPKVCAYQNKVQWIKSAASF